MRQRSDLLVISQLPPPFHGSTVMTVVFLETLEALDLTYRLVDRRFSKSLGSVGRIHPSKIFASFGLLWRLISAILRYKPAQTVFFMTNRPASFLVDWLLSEILRLAKIRTVGYIHTSGYTSLADRGPVWRFLVSRLLTSADTLVCLGPALESDVGALAPNARLVSIANTPYRLPENLAIPEARSNTILFLSNLIPEKGIDRFLALARVYSRDSPHVRFVAAGAPVNDAQLVDLRAAAGTNLEILGSVDSEQKWDLLNSADVLVFPSRYAFEAQPLVIVESMAVGLPVIAFDIGGIRDLVTDDRTGRLLPPDDDEGMHTALEDLIQSTTKRSAMSSAARQEFQSKYSRSAYKEAWLAVLTS